MTGLQITLLDLAAGRIPPELYIPVRLAHPITLGTEPYARSLSRPIPPDVKVKAITFIGDIRGVKLIGSRGHIALTAPEIEQTTEDFLVELVDRLGAP